MAISSSKHRRAFSLTAALLFVFATLLMGAGGVCCPCAIASAQRVACCQNTNQSNPCDCPTCARCRTVSFAILLAAPEQQDSQDDAILAGPDSTLSRSANDFADASLHAPQAGTALERCVRLARLTL